MDYLLVAVVARRLDGRRWTEHRHYPKAAATLFRRAAWALRGLVPTHPLNARLRLRLGPPASPP